MALLWGWKVERVRPNRFDLLGATIGLVGLSIIMYAPTPALRSSTARWGQTLAVAVTTARFKAGKRLADVTSRRFRSSTSPRPAMTKTTNPDPSAHPASHINSPRNTPAKERLRSLHILVVDDDKVDRLSLRRALAETGLEVTVAEAAGVMDAINSIASARFDCVLLDYNLPDGDGLTFLRGLRATGMSPAVIMITGQQDSAVTHELLASGAADYIPKVHLTPALLAETLERLFAGA